MYKVDNVRLILSQKNIDRVTSISCNGLRKGEKMDDIKIVAVFNLIVVIVGRARELIGLYRDNKREKKNSKPKKPLSGIS